MDITLLAGLVMALSLVLMLVIAVPIGISIGVSSALAMLIVLPFDSAVTTSAQKMFTGMDSFALMAIPFFILAGNIMNNGGIAIRLVNCAKLLSGRLPGSLAQTNVVANMLFGAISGSGAAAAAAIGGTMNPIQKKEGYAPEFAAAVNIASAPTGMLIPPSNTLIVYATVAGSVSIAALFMAGYIPGILWGLGVMAVAAVMAKRRGYVSSSRVPFGEAAKIFLDAIPSLLLIVIVIGGILKGIFTATEGSAIAVVYSLVLSFCYRTLKLGDLPRILLNSCKMTSIVIFMVGVSSIMSWVLAFTSVPTMVAEAMLALTGNKIFILMMMNVILLVVGTFMDPTPAVLIFTPIFLPICESFGMSPVHFGIMLVFNLCIGTITPPVGVILFTGCKVADVTIEQVIKMLLPFFFVTILVLFLVTYVPAISMVIPELLGLTG